MKKWLSVRPTLKVSSDAGHDLESGLEAVTGDQLFQTQVFVSPPVLFSSRVTIGLQKLLTVVGKIMIVQSEGRRGFHLQQPIDLFECDGMTHREDLINDGPNIPSVFKGPKETQEEAELT